MKLFNISAVALLSALPFSTAVDKGEQKWEVELNSATDQYNHHMTQFASQYKAYVDNPSDYSPLQELINNVENKSPSFGQDLIDTYNSLYGSSTDAVTDLAKDTGTSLSSIGQFDPENLTIVYTGTTIDIDGYHVGKGNEEITLEINTPLKEIDMLASDSTLILNASEAKYGYMYGNTLIEFEEGEIFNEVAYLAEHLSNITNTNILDINDYLHVTHGDIFGTDVDRSRWEVELSVNERDHGFYWSQTLYSDLGITPVSGSPLVGYLLFAFPMIAIFGPLVAKKINDHNMKVVVKKGGA